MRIDKYLASCALGSRKQVHELIKSGRVTLNANVIKSIGAHVDEENDIICVDGERIIYSRFVYLMLNKPEGVISATEDSKLKTVLDLVPDEYSHYNLFPVGRLDIDTTGLLLLTNDGALAHRLTSPKHHADKTYYATIDGVVTEADVDAFYKGIQIDDGYVCKSADLVIVKSDAVSEIELTIREGKFHQVKRMFEAVGKKVLSLKRIAMGGVLLDNKLMEGQMRTLSDDEIESLRSI